MCFGGRKNYRIEGNINLWLCGSIMACLLRLLLHFRSVCSESELFQSHNGLITSLFPFLSFHSREIARSVFLI